MSDEQIVIIGSNSQTVILPVPMIEGQKYTIKIGQPVRIDSSFQEVEITISKAAPKCLDAATGAEVPRPPGA